MAAEQCDHYFGTTKIVIQVHNPHWSVRDLVLKQTKPVHIQGRFRRGTGDSSLISQWSITPRTARVRNREYLIYEGDQKAFMENWVCLHLYSSMIKWTGNGELNCKEGRCDHSSLASLIISASSSLVIRWTRSFFRAKCTNFHPQVPILQGFLCHEVNVVTLGGCDLKNYVKKLMVQFSSFFVSFFQQKCSHKTRLTLRYTF